MKSNKIGILVQARMGSTRLPGKMLMEFYQGKGILELLLEQLTNSIGNKFPIIVCTTINSIDNEIRALCEKLEVECYRGSENDVLDRFVSCSEHYNFKKIIRICADNPFISMDFLNELLYKGINDDEIDYLGFQINGQMPAIKSHFGFFCEYVNLSALIKTQALTNNQSYLEHVTNFIYENEALFNVSFIQVPDYLKGTDNFRLTIDDISDFLLGKKLYTKYREYNLSHQDLVEIVMKDSEIINSMKTNINKNSK